MKESYTIPNKLISDINSLKKSAKRLTENVETLDKPRKGVALLEALKESKNYSAFYTDANKNVKQLTVSNGKVTLTGIGGNQSLANVAFKTNANGTAEQVKVVHAAALKGIDTLSKVTGLPWVLDDNLDEAVSKKDTVSGNDIALKYYASNVQDWMRGSGLGGPMASAIAKQHLKEFMKKHKIASTQNVSVKIDGFKGFNGVISHLKKLGIPYDVFEGEDGNKRVLWSSLHKGKMVGFKPRNLDRD